jgi:adenylate cyclase
MTIGRRADNLIVIYDLSASRVHAEINYDAKTDMLIINDLDSTNGTYVNRERLSSPKKLRNNDLIRIGEHVIDVSQVLTGEQLPKPAGTQPLTRDVVLESIDQHAVLMYEVAGKLNTVLDIDSALHEVSKMIRVALGADKCEVILARQFDRLSELGFPTSIAQMVIERRSAVILPDVSSEEEHFGKSAFLFRVMSALCVPVISGDDLLGLIYMYKTDPEERPFNQRDFQLAVAISHQAALTISRLTLLERVQEEQRIRQLLQRFVSPAEAEYIFQSFQENGRLPQLAEHRVSVMFADIADSTGLAESLGPQRFGELLNRYYQDMTDIIFEYNGLIDKFLGDGIMAVFGMTGKMGRHETRAVEAGLAMLNHIQAITHELPGPISIGVGVNTGVVVAGYVDTKQRVEFTVLGDTVNVAAGLERQARPNRLLVGPATVAAIVDRFETRRVGSVTVKGRTRDIQAHEVMRDGP